MSRTSENVKRWRRATKQRIVDSMGGKCQCCDYNRCTDSLDLHHIDPSEKDFGFGGMRANPKAWIKIAVELRKCVLVCRNCHGEIHAGVRTLPEDYARFDEQYVDYKRLFSPNEGTPDYGKRIEWSKVDLATELKTKSCGDIADELGITAAAVSYRKRKLCL